MSNVSNNIIQTTVATGQNSSPYSPASQHVHHEITIKLKASRKKSMPSSSRLSRQMPDIIKKYFFAAMVQPYRSEFALSLISAMTHTDRSNRVVSSPQLSIFHLIKPWQVPSRQYLGNLIKGKLHGTTNW